MTEKKKKDPLVLVEWLDHSGYVGNQWRDQDFVADDLVPTVIRTVGWILKETKFHIILISTRDDTQNAVCQHEMCIIKRTIIKRYTLKDPSRKIVGLRNAR